MILAPLRVACVLLLTVAGLTGASRAADLFTVAGVPVDASADSAAAARTKALASGQRQAFKQLLQRLTVKADWPKLPEPDEARLNEVVRSISLAEERTSPTRYIALLTVDFNRDAVRGLLRDRKIAFTESVARPVLVLPLHRTAQGIVLWEDPNPWRDAWAARDERSALVPLLSPLGDLDDVRGVTAEQAGAGDQTALTNLARRYGAGEVLVAIASPGPKRLDVSLRRQVDGTPQTLTETVPGELAPELYAAAVTSVIARLEEDWKRRSVLRFDDRGSLTARARFDSLDGWLQLRQKLSQAPEIRRLDIGLLTRNDAQLMLQHLGDVARLTQALAEREVELTGRDGAYEIRLKPGAVRDGQPAAAR